MKHATKRLHKRVINTLMNDNATHDDVTNVLRELHTHARTSRIKRVANELLSHDHYCDDEIDELLSLL
jgi:hypothetical protein